MKNIKRTWSILCLIFFAGNLLAQQIPFNMPMKYGKLENGLTYYIIHNEIPDSKVNMYLIQKTGSQVEQKSEYGMAHFVEHMMFHETKHFKDKQIINYFRSIGLDFGADVNATTNFDFTVYKIPNILTDRDAQIDSCLLILRDWACDASILPESVEKEHHIIKEEWRFRNSKFDMGQFYLDNFQGTAYSHMPIGNMQEVGAFSAKDIRDFYHHWYQPQLQAIVIVGGIDESKMEDKVKHMFSDIPKGTTQAPSWQKYPTYSHPRYFFYPTTDSLASVNISMRIPTEGFLYQNSVSRVIDAGSTSIFADILKNRLNVIKNKGNLYDFSVEYDEGGEGIRSIDSRVWAPTSKINQAIETMSKEILRMGQNEVSKDELSEYYTYVIGSLLENVLISYLPDSISPDSIQSWTLNKKWRRKSQEFNNEIVDNCTNNFLFNRPLCDCDSRTIINLYAKKKITPAILKKNIQKMIADSAITFNIFIPKDSMASAPKEAEIAALWNRLKATKLEPYKGTNSKAKDLEELNRSIASVKVSGSRVISKRVYTDNEKERCTELILSNGVKMTIKEKINNKNLYPEYHISGERQGIFSGLNDGDFRIVNAFLSHDKVFIVRNILFQKDGDSEKMNILASILNDYELKSLYRNLTEISEGCYNTTKMDILNTLEKPSPMSQAYDKLYLSYKNPNRFRPLTKEEVKGLSYERVKTAFANYLSNYNGSTFNIELSHNGKEKVDTLVSLFAKYIGALPSKNQKVKSVDRKGFYYIDHDDSVITRIKESKPITHVFLVIQQDRKIKADSTYSEIHDVLTEVLQNMLTDKLRLENASIYSSSVTDELSKLPHASERYIIYFTCSPEVRKHLVDETKELLRDATESDIINRVLAKSQSKIAPERVKKHLSHLLKYGHYFEDIITTE